MVCVTRMAVGVGDQLGQGAACARRLSASLLRCRVHVIVELACDHARCPVGATARLVGDRDGDAAAAFVVRGTSGLATIPTAMPSPVTTKGLRASAQPLKILAPRPGLEPGTMDRRETLLALSALSASTFGAVAQRRHRKARIGYLAGDLMTGAPFTSALVEGLRELGYVEGQRSSIAIQRGTLSVFGLSPPGSSRSTSI